MGRRYAAILRYLNIDFVGIDQGDAVPNKNYRGVIIATPTDTHVDLIEFYAGLGLPILCEKPITKDLHTLDRALRVKAPLTMVNQYEYLAPKTHSGETFYNYWNSGKDGPGWDCINIIGLARDLPAHISNKSPIWQCTINGYALKIQEMDVAYCRMIGDWVKKPHHDGKEYIERAHSRVARGDFLYEE